MVQIKTWWGRHRTTKNSMIQIMSGSRRKVGKIGGTVEEQRNEDSGEADDIKAGSSHVGQVMPLPRWSLASLVVCNEALHGQEAETWGLSGCRLLRSPVRQLDPINEHGGGIRQ